MRLLARTLGPALCSALALAFLPAGAAEAQTTDETWFDGPETTQPALDILSVRRVAAVKPGALMRVIIRFAQPIEAGDGLEVHFSTDRDLDPEVWFTGSASSEFEVYDVDHWQDNDDPVGLACGRMRFALDENRAVVKFDPHCLEDRVRAVRVNVQTYFHQDPRRREFAP